MDTSLYIPQGDGSEPAIELSMEAVYRAIGRLDEIAIVNSHKAPELCACFARAYAIMTDHLPRVTAELVKAQNGLQNRVAIVTLDEAPRILREKGLISARSPGGSEDLRKSVLEVDPEYIRLRDLVQQLEAFQELLKGKQKAVENGYLAVRKMMGDVLGYQGRNPRLGSSMPASPAAEAEEPAVKPNYQTGAVDLRGQFGRPRD